MDIILIMMTEIDHRTIEEERNLERGFLQNFVTMWHNMCRQCYLGVRHRSIFYPSTGRQKIWSTKVVPKVIRRYLASIHFFFMIPGFKNPFFTICILFFIRWFVSQVCPFVMLYLRFIT